MVQNRDLCLRCCDWIGAGSLGPLALLSVSFSHSLPLDVVASVSEMVGEPLRTLISIHTHSHTHTSHTTPSSPNFPRQRKQTLAWREGRLTFRQGHQTLPHL